MDACDILFSGLLLYPLVGLALYAVALFLVPAENVRANHERHQSPSVVLTIIVAMLLWPMWLVRAIRTSQGD
jgi:hypothetical protein